MGRYIASNRVKGSSGRRFAKEIRNLRRATPTTGRVSVCVFVKKRSVCVCEGVCVNRRGKCVRGKTLPWSCLTAHVRMFVFAVSRRHPKTSVLMCESV